jgi:SAM-dependent methyltransferase
MYNISAFLYEKICAFETPETTCDEIHNLLVGNGVRPAGLLGDFGSGTGLMGIQFAQKGWSVYGIELSNAMIAVANERTKALDPQAQERIKWIQGDITRFELPVDTRLDAAICLCNTINHLPEWEQVTSFLHSVFHSLKEGAIFILDSDKIETFLHFFDHPPLLVWDDGKHRMTRTCKFNKGSGRANHTALVEKYANGKPEAIGEEAMSLQYYSEKQLTHAFREAGFTIKSALPFNGFPTLYQHFIPKLLWVLEKTA